MRNPPLQYTALSAWLGPLYE